LGLGSCTVLIFGIGCGERERHRLLLRAKGDSGRGQRVVAP
jgi:hypothetical protein